MPSFDCLTKFGVATAASPVAWAGGGNARRVADWLPRIDEPFAELRNGKYYITPRWYNFQRAMADRLGGVQGQSITQIQQTTIQIQAQVAENTSYTVQAVDYTTQVAAAVTATAEVAQSSALPGSASIPPTGDPPPRPDRHVQ